ncbi:tetratricopeptide repeat protein, partial [Vagococcus sp. BWB3-3]
MKRAFLSHNGADKPFVLDVYKELGHVNAVIDSHQFIEGVDLRNQINTYILNSEVFVLFASKESLSAPWVTYELNIAEMAVLNRDIANILVILIDKDITHANLPKWLQNSLIRYVETPKIAASLIRSILETKVESLFLGRGEDQEKFARHYFSSDRNSRNLVFFGLDGIGRRSFAKYIVKQNFNLLLSSEYQIEGSKSLISLYRDLLLDSMTGLSISKIDENIRCFSELELAEQVSEILNYLNNFAKHNQVPILVDKGGMLNSEGEFKTEILELMNQINKTDNLFVMFLLTRNPRGYNNNLYFVSFVPPLSLESSAQLLKQYCNVFHSINISKEDSNTVGDYIAGYPPAVRIASNDIHLYGIDMVKESPVNLIHYNKGVFDEYINNNIKKEEEYLLKIINNFGSLSLKILMNLVPDSNKLINRLIDLSIVTLNVDSQSYSISTPVVNALNQRYGVLNKNDYKSIVGRLKNEYLNSDNVPDIKTLDVLIVCLLRSDVNNGLDKFKKLILPSDIYKSAMSAYKSKDWLTAKNLFEKLLKLDKDNISALEYYIRSKIRLKENTDADLRKMHDLSIEKYLSICGFKYLKAGKFTLAAEKYENVKKNYYASPYIYRDLGECYYQLGELDKVREILNEGLVKTNFKNKFMLDLAAKNAIRQNNFDDARSYLGQLEQVDTQGSVLHRKSSLYSKEGNLIEARKCAEQAVSQENSRREFYLLLANIHISLGDLVSAKKTLDETYEKYRQLNIGSDNGFLNLMCLYYIRTKNMTKSR